MKKGIKHKGRKTATSSTPRPTPTQNATLTGRDAWIARLRAGENVSFRESGNSMTPRIKHREKCTYAPVTSISDIKVGDAVFCKVGPNYFTHLVTSIRGKQVQISNNHGHVNGWTHISHVFGKVIKVGD